MERKRKRPPKNAFSFFLNDYVEGEREKGRHISHRIAAEECGLLWKELPEEEKQRYSQLAAFYKVHSKQDNCSKFTCTGVSFAQLLEEQKEERLKVEKADTEIKTTISNLDFKLLKTHLFYIIHCNYYCKTDRGIFVPGELAIVEFSLGDGVRRKYHTLINPGPIPMGYAFEARKTIEEIHGLPYPPFSEGDSDYFGILDKVLEFLEPGKLPDGRYPPLYSIENNIEASRNVLQALGDNKCEGGDFFRVFPLHKMFFWLKNKCVECVDDENVGFPVMYNAESEIAKDVFCYSPGISCSFHNASEEKYFSCSLSVVQRQVYTICDHCCRYIEVQLIPLKHCWLKTDTDGRVASSRAEKLSQRSLATTPLRELDYDGSSSYADDISCFDWTRDQGGRFLHEEIESKFSALELLTGTSRCTSQLSTPDFSAASVRTCSEIGDDEESHLEQFKTVLPSRQRPHRP